MASCASVPAYYSDPEDILETVVPSCSRKKRSHSWIYESTYSNKEAAKNFINSENTWSCHYKNHTEEGNKYYYRCNKSKRRVNDCPAGLNLLFNSHNDEILLFRSENDHDYNNLESCNASEIKTKIETLFELHLQCRKFSKILRKLTLIYLKLY